MMIHTTQLSLINLTPNHDGIVAFGAPVTVENLMCAYKESAFPWFNQNEMPIWWSPDPRMVFDIKTHELNKSWRKLIKKSCCEIRIDDDFAGTMQACAQAKRSGIGGTWIGKDFIENYCQLFELGFAHNISAYCNGQRVGGLYGLKLGSVFFGESMYSIQSGGSKLALAGLFAHAKKNGIIWVDCQVENPHLKLLGASNIPRSRLLEVTRSQQWARDTWKSQFSLEP